MLPLNTMQSVQFVQGRTVYRVSVSAVAASNLQALLIAELNLRQPGLGDEIVKNIIGGSAVSSATFTVGDSAALVATKSILATVEYTEPTTNFLRDTWAIGASPIIVTVYVAV